MLPNGFGPHNFDAIADVAGRRTTVWTDDEVALAVYESGPRSAPLTVVLVHGHCMSSIAWNYVRLQLLGGRSDVRVVCYDHRGHGRSGDAGSATYNLDQLGRDLASVLRVVVPTGPVVLVGHSMGAMATMTYVRQHPDGLGSRIVGIAFVATAVGRLSEAGLGRLLRTPLLRAFNFVSTRTPLAVSASARLSRRMCQVVVRQAAFGKHPPSPKLVAAATAMLSGTPPRSISGFLQAFAQLDEYATLSLLDGLPVLVVGGSDDQMTPFAHSQAIASGVRDSQLVCITGAGHSVILDRANEVAEHLSALLDRVQQRLPIPAVAIAG